MDILTHPLNEDAFIRHNNIHNGVVGTEIRPQKLRQLINITSKRQLIQLITIKEIYIYIYSSTEWAALGKSKEGVLEYARSTDYKFCNYRKF